MVGQTLTATYFRPGTLHKDDGVISSQPFTDGKEEWILIDGTPASCIQIGLYHFFKDRGPVDLVVSGPNFGRNTTALFALSSGTLGGALEGAVCGKKSIALSYAFDARDMYNADMIASASRMSTRLIEKFVSEWPEDVDLFSVNVPLQKDAENAKVVYCEMLQNQWKRGSSYQKLTVDEEDAEPAGEKQNIHEGSEAEGNTSGQIPKRTQVKFKWAPNFADVWESMEASLSGDGWAVLQGHIRYVFVLSIRIFY
jgi:tubulin---tyrosine ligase